jgi:hypothetical protein
MDKIALLALSPRRAAIEDRTMVRPLSEVLQTIGGLGQSCCHYVLRTLTPMAQQDKISILGPREDGTYVVEFRTAAGERLAIAVPRTKSEVLKHFQVVTADQAPIADEGTLNSIVKPEVRNILRIGWSVVRGILELAIMVYVLGSILDPGDTIIVAVLGIIYASIRSAALFQYFTIMQMGWASDRQFLEQKRLEEDPNVDSEIANTDSSMSRILLNSSIAGAFIALQYLVCLIYIFSKL